MDCGEALNGHIPAPPLSPILSYLQHRTCQLGRFSKGRVWLLSCGTSIHTMLNSLSYKLQSSFRLTPPERPFCGDINNSAFFHEWIPLESENSKCHQRKLRAKSPTVPSLTKKTITHPTEALEMGNHLLRLQNFVCLPKLKEPPQALPGNSKDLGKAKKNVWHGLFFAGQSLCPICPSNGQVHPAKENCLEVIFYLL